MPTEKPAKPLEFIVLTLCLQGNGRVRGVKSLSDEGRLGQFFEDLGHDAFGRVRVYRYLDF